MLRWGDGFIIFEFYFAVILHNFQSLLVKINIAFTLFIRLQDARDPMFYCFLLLNNFAIHTKLLDVV